MNGSSYFQLLNPLILFLFSFGFASIYFTNRKLSSAFWLAIAYAVGAVGFVLDFAVRDAAGPYLGSYISNVPFMVGLLLVSISIHARYSDTLPWRAAAGIGILTFAVVTGFVLQDPNSFSRALAMNIGSGLAWGLAIPPLWKRRAHPDRTLVEKILLVLFAVNVAQSFVRPILVGVFVGFDAPLVSYSDSLYALTLHLVSGVAAISIAATLLFSLGMDLVRLLNRQVAEDPLTGLLNRRGFDEAMLETFHKLDRCDLPFSIVVCDLDNFKQVNDRWGHVAGDEVIKKFSNVLQDNLRASDYAARIGGEEFVIALWNTDLSGAKLFAEVRRSLFEGKTFKSLPRGTSCTASFGIAQRQPQEDIMSMIGRADRALYNAKRSGKNRVCRAESNVEYLTTDISAVA